MLKAPRQQVALIGISTVLAGFSLISIINFTDPGQSSLLTFAFFYLSLFITALGLSTILGLSLRQMLGQKVFVVNLGTSFRQGILIAILVLVSFLLLSQDLLFWWVELSLILFLLFVEIFLNLKT